MKVGRPAGIWAWHRRIARQWQRRVLIVPALDLGGFGAVQDFGFAEFVEETGLFHADEVCLKGKK